MLSQLSIDCSSIRYVLDNVVVRAWDGPEAERLFAVDGIEYPVIVCLNTLAKRVIISVNDGVMLNAIAIAKELWGEECEGNETRAISPSSRWMYITDARAAAEYIKP